MKQQFSEYLTSIGITDLFRQRIEDICALFDDLWKVEVFDIFVTDYVDNDGRRNYEDLFLFTAEGIVEALQFLTKDVLALNYTTNRPIYLKIDKQNYDFKQATLESRMSFTVYFTSEVRCHFKASQENCDHLQAILLKYFIPGSRDDIDT